MIYFLKGIVEDLGDDFLALDVNGVGYQAYASSRTLSTIDTGEVLKMYIYTNHSEQHGTTLYGFKTEEERQLFETLTSVSGAGAKVGLAILSALSPEEIINAITAGDGKMLSRAKGVGPKLGERLVRELSGKVGSLPTGVTGATVTVTQGTTAAEVVSALGNLGYNQSQAQKAVSQASDKVGDDAAFDALFKQSLQELR